MSASGMKQIEERHVASCVEMMVWCNRMDLLALSNSKGEVHLHRLNWQRVWLLPPPMEHSLVRGMAWRPDGKVLAVGYSCGRISLVDVEDKEILFASKISASDASPSEGHGSVTCLSWGQRSTSQNSQSGYRIYDDSSTFLPHPRGFNSNYNKTEENLSDFKECKEQTHLNILMVGYEDGEFHMSVFGFYPCGIIDMKKYFNSQTDNLKLIDAQLSDDFTTLQIFVENSKDSRLKLMIFDTEVLAAYSDELHALATKHGYVVNLIAYVDQTMTSITEAWEQILLEMDSKLEKYASHVPEGGVSADFLDLLMLGVPSDELELFLLQDLTAKGLKKFGSSIELSYSTIQRLVLKHLNTVGYSLTYHLAELRGLARITHRYQILGLEEEAVTQALSASSAFINKCLELQQVIDHSMKNYKAFFRWLYVVIIRLMDEHVPPEIVKITQQDLTYIAEFLQNFDKVGVENSEFPKDGSEERKTGKFNLERLGQYLVNKDLTITTEDDENPWMKFLKDNSCLSEYSGIMKSFKKFSLVQQQEYLKNSIQKVFNCSEKSLATQFTLLNIIDCVPCNFNENLISSSLRVTQINVPEENCVLLAFTDTTSSDRGFYFVEVSYKNDILFTKSSYFYFHACGNLNDSKLESLDGNRLKTVDVQFYSVDTLSVLLEQPNDEEISAFVQFPVKIARDGCKQIQVSEIGSGIDSVRNVTRVNAFGMLEPGTCKILDKISVCKIAVSGGRKVAVVLSKTCRKVRLFEMEVDGEDDEDETLDTTPQSHSTTQHSDTSQHILLNDTALLSSSIQPMEGNQISEPLDLDTSDIM